MATTLERVQAGAAFLDEKWGSKEWREQIEVDELDMAHAGLCILGQLYGDYHWACRKLGVPPILDGLGFTVSCPELYHEEEIGREWDALERAWIACLKGEMTNGNISR
jgi:hypothetical protein